MLADEVSCRQEKGEPILINQPVEGKLFLQLWMKENEDFVEQHFGSKEDNCIFIIGSLFAPSTATHTVKYLLKSILLVLGFMSWVPANMVDAKLSSEN